MLKNSNYDVNSIQSLSFREGVRQRVQMYLGSDDIEGTYQAFKEILNNSTDEALAGYGKNIDIDVDEKTNSITITDYGRGVPFGIKDGKNVLVSIYTDSHTGGKFNNSAYKNSSGLNGVGGSCVCLSSSKFEVTSRRDGSQAYAYFEEGELIDYKEESCGSEPNGTSVTFIPDKKVFSNGEIGYEYSRIKSEIKDISYLYPGVTFTVRKIEKSKTAEKEVFCAKEGIVDFIKDHVETPFNKHIIYQKINDENDELEIAFQWGTKKEQAYVFVNGLRCPEGGTPITGAKASIVRTINTLTGKEFNGDKVRENLCYVINCKVANPSFANQTKSKINNPNLRVMASTAFTDAIKEMQANHTEDFDNLVDMFIKLTKAEAAAEKAREAFLKHEKREENYKKSKINNPDKFKDCEKHGEDSILIIAEGNSALSGLNPARDIDTEALYAVRGKVINLMKHSLEDCLTNQEISDIIFALGCGIQDKYNPKKLNYGKVAIATDADVDGYSIMCLISTMFYVLMPKFIEEGRLCWLRAPLYKLSKGKEKAFAYNDEELENLKKTHKNWTQTRNKGLGEMNADDMEKSMMNKNDRRLEVLTIHDAVMAEESIGMLMGTDVASRKKFLFDNVDFSKINN